MKMIIKTKEMILILLAIIITAGCQAVFTTSPFGDMLHPAPEDIPDDMLTEYCWDIMANGTPEEQEAAFAALQASIADGNTDPDLNYVAGVMALDQMGFTMDSFQTGTDDTAALEDLQTTITENFALMQEMGSYFDTAQDGGAELTASDQIFGGIGIIFNTVETPEDLATIDLENPSTETEAGADMINEGLASISGADSSGITTEVEVLVLLMLSGE